MATLALTAALILPLHAHTVDQLESWEDDWSSRAADTQTVDLMDERRDMRNRHEWFFDPLVKEVASAGRTRPPATTPPPTVWPGDWAALVAAYFWPEYVDAALRIIQCESQGDPGADNPYSTAAGLFQFLRSTWDRVAVPLGYGNYDSGAVYDPVANIHAASVLSKGGSDWSQWTCKP